MQLHFSKYHGTGNDFILIDNRADDFPKSMSLIQHFCDRNFGVGSDGLVLIENHPTLDYRMVFFNPDGSESLCGNGSRCGFVFAQSLGMVNKKASFETTDGIHKAEQYDSNVRISLFDVENIKQAGEAFFLNTGSPHYVRIVSDLTETIVIEVGREIRYSEAYSSQNGTNVNFAQLLQDRVLVRTYERGVEDETLSCGTGVTAVALVAGQLGYDSPVEIETLGGNLRVEFTRTVTGFQDIWLTGPVKFVFEGTIDI
ncbi:MAG: diaminopimelate epimerase [Cytophagales bacterium]|nr:diaminopimelate epimerase [Cytophagales bacterium]